MSQHVIFLSIPGLRASDLGRMPALQQLTARGEQSGLVPSFPCVTWPAQTAMLTGKLPREHGVVANGFYWRDTHEVEMWTAWNEKIQSPQIWDVMHAASMAGTSAVWFPMLSKGCGADYVCMPAPIHNPDGSESLWCYTKPTELYGELRDALGHFPLQHFWGPLANIKSTEWIARSAALAIGQFQPNLTFVYLPHLDYAAQKLGPDSEAALQAVTELDRVIQEFAASVTNSLPQDDVLWLVASEYTIVPVDHVSYPNRVLRELGLLTVKEGEELDFAASQAWALVDHQFSHVFVQNADEAVIHRVVDRFQREPGIAEVLTSSQLSQYGMDHPRSGEVVLISDPHSWQAYYWWQDDAQAPAYARSVDIHRKPGYDPVELHFDLATKSIPLDATLIGGSHGAPARDAAQQGILLASHSGVLNRSKLDSTEVFGVLKRQLGID